MFRSRLVGGDQRRGVLDGGVWSGQMGDPSFVRHVPHLLDLLSGALGPPLHRSLRVAPAMESGVSDRLWSIDEFGGAHPSLGSHIMVVILIRRFVRADKEDEFLRNYLAQKPLENPEFLGETLTRVSDATGMPAGLRGFALNGSAARGVCAAAARSRSCAGGFWRGAGGDRRGRAQDSLLCDGPAAQRRLFYARLSGGNCRGVLRRAQCGVWFFRQGAALDV